ncbi:MAG: histidine kinase [Verrucomicrobiota bacterium]
MPGQRATAVCSAILFTAAGFPAAAPAFVPYEPDEDTLHLWHLDERQPPFRDSAAGGRDLLGLLNGATAAQPSIDGFGSSVSFNYSHNREPEKGPIYGPILLSKPKLDTGPLDQVEAPFPIMGEDGAFTIEALVKLDVLVGDARGMSASIVSLDDEVLGQRVFLFRIEKPGFLSFLPISGNSARSGGLATLPTTGPHAVNTTDWFHVAVTYSGKEAVADNLKLYWTRIGAGDGVANQIGRGSLTADLNRELGDFAIGNTGRTNPHGPWEYFPGYIDEVRISSIARKPEDFFFVSPELRARKKAEDLLEKAPQPPKKELILEQVLVDNVPMPVTPGGGPLEMGPGPHRLDFDFKLIPPGSLEDPLAVKCSLQGLDDGWLPTARGMTMAWEMLDAEGVVLSSTAFTASASSEGWEKDILDSTLVRRVEPLTIPERTRQIRVSVSSGTPDTTGRWVIDNMSLTRISQPDVNLWANGNFEKGVYTNQPTGVPSGWTRELSKDDPSDPLYESGIARIVLKGEDQALGLDDADQDHYGRWRTTQTLKTEPAAGGEVFLASWSEAYNVIPGSSLRATYLSVPSGKYTFRAIAVAGEKPEESATRVAFPLVIHEPFWRQAWFYPILVAAALGMTGLGLFSIYRRRSRERLARIRLQSMLERDRARIARDMHDDLGTRVSVLNLTASFVRRAIDSDPGKARQQVIRMESAARDLVQAMEGLVWAVNPANDTLDHLAVHLAGVAHDLFRDSPVRLRLSIPPDLPAIPLTSDFRNHFALAVKESLNNTLKYAGPCEVSVKLSAEGNALLVEVADTGAGFDPSLPREGNGLRNLASRFKELGGTFNIDSKPGNGTRVSFHCLLPKIPSLPNS